MKPVNTKFNLNDSLDEIDQILKSGDVVMRKENYTPEDSKGARGSIINVSVVSAKFIPVAKSNQSLENWAKANDALLSQIYAMVACQPQLLNFEWDGCMLHAIFNTTHKEHIDGLLDTVGKILSLTDVINYKVAETGWSYIIKAAIDYKKALSVPINKDTTLWKVDGLFELDELLDDLNTKRLIISKFIYNNLKEGYQALFQGLEPFDSKIYQADIVNIGINNWLKEQRGEK